MVLNCKVMTTEFFFHVKYGSESDLSEIVAWYEARKMDHLEFTPKRYENDYAGKNRVCISQTAKLSTDSNPLTPSNTVNRTILSLTFARGRS